MSDNIQHLIKACIRGERQAQMQFFKLHNNYLFSICMKYMQDRNEAEEALQDAWIDIFKSLKNYKDEGKVQGWLKTITLRTCWKAIRKRSKVQNLDAAHHLSGPSVNDQVMDKMTCDEVLELLVFLPAASRQVFKMYVLDEYKHEEISKILEITTSTSRAHLAKARKLLRGKFERLNKIAHNGLKAI